MEFNLWGTHEEAKPLSPSIQKMLEKMLGVTPPCRAGKRAPFASPPRRSPTPTANVSPPSLGRSFISDDADQRLPRARGKSYLDLLDWRADKEIAAPDLVVAPADEERVLEILRYCSEEGIAVVPFGGGTSVVGGLNPVPGTHRAVISLDLGRLRPAGGR